MAGEKRRARVVYALMFWFVAALVLLVSVSFVGTAMDCNKVDYQHRQVYRLSCTFDRKAFDVRSVMSNATGQKFTWINITLENGQQYLFYTLNTTAEKIADVGVIHWNKDSLLAYSSEALEDKTDYVIDSGTIMEIDLFGTSDSPMLIVQIDKIHKTTDLEKFLTERPIMTVMLFGFASVLLISVFSLPIAEYLINSDKEEKAKKTRKSPSLPNS